MATERQRQTPIKNVGGAAGLNRSDDYRNEEEQEASESAQREAVRRASEPAIDLGPDSPLLEDTNPDDKLSANKRGGGSHGGSSRDHTGH